MSRSALRARLMLVYTYVLLNEKHGFFVIWLLELLLATQLIHSISFVELQYMVRPFYFRVSTWQKIDIYVGVLVIFVTNPLIHNALHTTEYEIRIRAGSCFRWGSPYLNVVH